MSSSKRKQKRTPAAIWLDKEDRSERNRRIKRLQWLAEIMPSREYLLYPGGWMSMHLLEEARYSFVYGQYLATIVLGMAYIERTLAAFIYGAGRSDLERAAISVLLREGVEEGWLTPEEYTALDHARTLRNPVAHFRAPLTEDTIEHRSLMLGEQPYSVLEQDARNVIQAAFHILGRRML